MKALSLPHVPLIFQSNPLPHRILCSGGLQPKDASKHYNEPLSRAIEARMLWLLFALTAGPTEAANGWERIHLGDYVSDPGEPLELFLKRLGLVLDAHTKATGHETCGMIGWQAATSRHAVALYTDGVQRGCSMRYSQVPDGFVSTRETIHSHPYATSIVLRDADRAWNKAHNDLMYGRTVTLEPGFSQGDFDAGPGWLVFQGTLQYQKGPTRIRRFGKLDWKAPVPALLPSNPSPTLLATP